MASDQSEQHHIRWRFIVNPASRGGKGMKRWPEIERLLHAEKILFDVVYTKKQFHAFELTVQAVAEGIRHLVAVGGDGTAHEVVNGIFQQDICPTEEITFTLLPLGTGNDWIKTHRIPKNSKAWLKFFQKGKTAFQDIGWLTYHKNKQQHKRFFMNVAGLSYDGFVAEKAGSFKSRGVTALFYVFLAFRCLSQFKIPRASIAFNGRTVENKFYTINAGICRYSGGGLQIVPHADTCDRKLALTLIERVSKLEVLLISPLFYLGKIGLHPAVSMYQADEISVKPADGEAVLVEADGEFLGEAPVSMGIMKSRLKILIP